MNSFNIIIALLALIWVCCAAVSCATKKEDPLCAAMFATLVFAIAYILAK